MKPCWKLVGSQRTRTDAARIDVWFHEGHESKDHPVEYDHDEPMISLRAVEGISSQEAGTEAESILMLSEARRLAGMLEAALSDAAELVPPKHGDRLLVPSDPHIMSLGIIHAVFGSTVAVSIHHGHEGESEGHELTLITLTIWPEGIEEQGRGPGFVMLTADVRDLIDTMQQGIKRHRRPAL